MFQDCEHLISEIITNDESYSFEGAPDAVAPQHSKDGILYLYVNSQGAAITANLYSDSTGVASNSPPQGEPSAQPVHIMPGWTPIPIHAKKIQRVVLNGASNGEAVIVSLFRRPARR